MPRFFVPCAQFGDGSLTIVGEDAHHISRSLRMAVGEQIVVCPADGPDAGVLEHDCVLTRFDGTTVEAEIVRTSPCLAEPPYVARLYVALSKADKLEMVIQKAVECGASEIVPFTSSRCIVRVGDGEEKKQVRRAKIAAEAAKQCGRGRIPTVALPISYAEMLRDASEADLPLFCYEDERALTLPQAVRSAGATATVALVVGSEGGFSPEEATAAREAGLIPVGLGNRILRCETAPIFALSCLSYALELDEKNS